MELIPAPGRVTKTHSFIILSLLLFFDLLQAVFYVFEKDGALSVTTVAVVNLVLVFLAQLVRLYQQQIPVTPEQKVELVTAAATTPVKPGYEDPAISVTVTNPPQRGFARLGLLSTLAAVALAVVLVGCGSLGLPQPKTFDDHVAVSLTSVTQVRKVTRLLLEANKITAADAQNVQKQADLAREGIDIARAIQSTDPAGAQTKLTAAVTVLQALDAYLATKGAKP